MLADGVTVATGLGWVANVNVEPRLLPDQNWGQAIRLRGRAPTAPAVGIDVGHGPRGLRTARAVVRGASAAVVIDGRKATFGTGTNGSLAAAWMVIDTLRRGRDARP